MYALTPSAPSTSPRNTRYQRVVMLLVLMFLAMQLIVVGAHHHAYAESHNDDCAACMIADMPLAAPPPMAAVVPLAPQAGFAAPVFSPALIVPRTSYLTPPSHAPPAAVLF